VANGFVAFLTMPKTEDPLVQPPGSTVVVLYPGGSPQDMERLFVDPIEKALNTLDDIKLITSLASDGLATIHIEFQVGSDAQEKYDRVVQEINTIRGELPQDLLSLETVKWSIVDVSILQLALVSETAPYRQLEQESERLQDRLEKSSGVNKVEIHALPAQEVRISLDLAQLAGRGLSLQQVIAAIQDGNSDVPGGAVEIGSKRLSIKTDGAFASLAEIRRAAVMAGRQGVTALEEIADVEWRTEDVEYLARFNGKRCIYLTVSQKPASNIFTVFDQIRPLVDDFRTTLPHDIDLQIAFDQSAAWLTA
jgi:multidrug efflux pump subunit AcrB